MPWQLAPVQPGEVAYVYARFCDDAGNKSVATEVGSILMMETPPHTIYLPAVVQ